MKFNAHSQDSGTQARVMAKPWQLLFSRCESSWKAQRISNGVCQTF